MKNQPATNSIFASKQSDMGKFEPTLIVTPPGETYDHLLGSFLSMSPIIGESLGVVIRKSKGNAKAAFVRNLTEGQGWMTPMVPPK